MFGPKRRSYGVVSVEYEAQAFGFKEADILAHSRRFLRALGIYGRRASRLRPIGRRSG